MRACVCVCWSMLMKLATYFNVCFINLFPNSNFIEIKTNIFSFSFYVYQKLSEKNANAGSDLGFPF